MNNFVSFVNRKQFLDAPGNGKIDIDNIVHNESLFNEHATTSPNTRFLPIYHQLAVNVESEFCQTKNESIWGEICNADVPCRKYDWICMFAQWVHDVCDASILTLGSNGNYLRVHLLFFLLCFALHCLCFPIPYDTMRCDTMSVTVFCCVRLHRNNVIGISSIRNRQYHKIMMHRHQTPHFVRFAYSIAQRDKLKMHSKEDTTSSRFVRKLQIDRRYCEHLALCEDKLISKTKNCLDGKNKLREWKTVRADGSFRVNLLKIIDAWMQSGGDNKQNILHKAHSSCQCIWTDTWDSKQKCS